MRREIAVASEGPVEESAETCDNEDNHHREIAAGGDSANVPEGEQGNQAK